MTKILPTVLTIAGSDSGGGAGIQADLRTFSALQVYGCSVITAVTAQNPNEVRRVDILPPDSIQTQLETVLTSFPIHYAKTGMLGNKETVESIAFLAQKYQLKLIVDPVMISTSGAKLLEDSAITVIKEKLFPLADWITPNIPEAEFICKRKLSNQTDYAEAALYLYKQFKCNCLLKSGHALTSNLATDIVCYQGELFTVSSPTVKIRGNTAHGTGCTLSSALTAISAQGKNWQQAIIEAKAFVYGSLYENMKLSDDLSQMYPPEKNYLNNITFKPYQLSCN